MLTEYYYKKKINLVNNEREIRRTIETFIIKSENSMETKRKIKLKVSNNSFEQNFKTF